MSNFLGKLLNSSGTLAILSVVALSIGMSNLDTKIEAPKKIEGRPIEEIMIYSPAATSDSPWDHEFQSSITPIKEGE